MVFCVCIPFVGLAQQKNHVAASPLHRFYWVNPPKEDRVSEGLHHKRMHSELHQAEIGYTIYLPKDYSAERKQGYPVVYFLHGGGGSETSLLQTVFARRINAMLEKGVIEPFIMVFPNGGKATQFEDFKNGKLKISSYLSKEFFPLIDKEYNIDQSRRRIEGISMGGLGAVKMALRNPGYFSSVAIYGGAMLDMEHIELTPKPDKQKQQLKFTYGNDLEYVKKVSIQRAIMQNKKITNGLDLTIVIGDADTTLSMNKRFHELLKKQGIAVEYILLPGAEHNMDHYLKTWQQQIRKLLGKAK